MSVRRLVSIAGRGALFALDSEGEGWFWTGSTWTPWGRPFIPPAIDTGAPVAQAMLSAQAEDRQRNAGGRPATPQVHGSHVHKAAVARSEGEKPAASKKGRE